MEIKNTALLIEGEHPKFFYDESDALDYIMDRQSHVDAPDRSVPDYYLGLISKDVEAGLIYRDRDWLEEQFAELNRNAAEKHNQEYEARYGD